MKFYSWFHAHLRETSLQPFMIHS